MRLMTSTGGFSTELFLETKRATISVTALPQFVACRYCARRYDFDASCHHSEHPATISRFRRSGMLIFFEYTHTRNALNISGSDSGRKI